jgi:trimethylamine--corrinoid protein Co-methyltransferase
MFGFASHISHGVSNIWGVGQLESELTISPAQAVMDSEMISYVNRFLRGVDTNDETLAVDVTREVGITGSYLDHPHTAEFFRSELFMPKLLLRKKRDNWSAAGSKRLDEHAEDVAQELMKPSDSPSLGEAEHKELQEIADWFSKNKK